MSQHKVKPTIRPVRPADTDQPVHPPVGQEFSVIPLDSLEAIEGTCDQ